MCLTLDMYLGFGHTERYTGEFFHTILCSLQPLLKIQRNSADLLTQPYSAYRGFHLKPMNVVG